MPRKFDFISPGIQLREIDQSQIANQPQDDGVLIIGQAKTGPIGKPVKVKNLSEMVSIFGEPQSGVGAGSSDVWRNGNEQVATYGLYAAKAWLSSETSPVTFIRLGGETTSTTVQAGWNLGWDLDTDPAEVDLAYGLFICPSASNGAVGVTGSLAAVIYTTGSAVTLSGNRADPLGSTTTSSAGVFIISGGDRLFKLDVHSAAGTSVSHNLNFSEEMSKVRNGSINKNPQKLVTTNYGAADTKKEFLGETYETRLNALLAAASSTGTGKQFAILLPLVSGSAYQTNRNRVATAAKTGWFINRDPNPTASPAGYSPESMQKLFRLVSLHEGSFFHENYAVRISNLSLGTNANPNSSFSVIIVNKAGEAVETYSNCNLDPSDDNYVAKRIGDQYQTWNTAAKKYNLYGSYPNNSDYVYVEMQNSLGDDALKIPFGFYGPTKPKDFIMTSGSSPVVANPYRWAGPALGSALYGGNTTGAGFGTSGTNGLGEAGQVIRMQWPRLELTEQNTYDGETNYSKKQSLGIRQARSTDTTGPNTVYYQEDYKDLLRPLPNGGDIFESNSTYEYSFVFSMDDVIVAADGKAYYESGSHVASTAETATGIGTNALLQTAGFRSFTAPFFGGADGLDITQVDPFSSVTVLDGQSVSTHYAYYSVDKAIELVEDPELVQFDVASVPGLTNSDLVQKVINMSEERGDNLAIIDIDSGFKQPYEDGGTESLGSVSDVLASARTLDYNSNYAATYYPPVRLAASEGGIGVPSSVAGIGVLAQSDADSGAPWFAPAGFNRGGIKYLGCASTNGACGGVKVSAGIENLTKAERDDLYEININPIANFPGEGTVVFGQKTLQQTPSALDRINVRRLMIYLKKRIGKVAQTILFDNSVQATWTRFKNGADPILADAKSRFGISEYKLILDSTTTTPDLIDRNILYAQVFIKPARAIEFIAIDFIITKTGIEF